MPDWRAHLAWPLSQQARTEISLRLFSKLFDWLIATPEGRLKNAVSLASVRFLGVHARLLIAAAEQQSANALGLAFTGLTPNPPGGVATGPTGQTSNFVRQQARTARDFAASLRSSSRWTSLSRLPLAMLKPDTIVLSQNSLLRSEIAATDSRFRHIDAAVILRQAPAARADEFPELKTFARQWANDLADDAALEGAEKDRLSAQLYATILSALQQADSDLARLAGLPKLPNRVWAATGGRYPTRAVSIACQQRGGEVVRFAHGGAPVFDGYPQILSYVDFMPCTTFVAPTEGAADIVRTRLPAAVTARSQVVGGSGDPLFATPRHTRKAPASRPIVVYCPTIFVGSICHFPPVLPDPVYLDWQLRLVETLSTMPIDLKGRPHPENIMLSGRQPLDTQLETIGGSFADVVEQADALVFDWPLSTSFWEALCSDCRVILLNVCNTAFNPAVMSLIRERCTIVETGIDDRNRPSVERDTLADALQFSEAVPDPSPIRALLAGAA